MNRSQKQALRFAYRLARGDYRAQPLIYTWGDWFEPDRSPERPYLSENTLAALAMRGYLECQLFWLDDMAWLYRISRQGCERMGWAYPLLNGFAFRGEIEKHLPFQSRRRFPPPPRDLNGRGGHGGSFSRKQRGFKRR